MGEASILVKDGGVRPMLQFPQAAHETSGSVLGKMINTARTLCGVWCVRAYLSFVTVNENGVIPSICIMYVSSTSQHITAQPPHNHTVHPTTYLATLPARRRSCPRGCPRTVPSRVKSILWNGASMIPYFQERRIERTECHCLAGSAC